MTEISGKKSPNCRPRVSQQGRPWAITAIVLHDTVGAAPGAIDWLCNPESGVSAHVVITKAGEIYRLVDDDEIAYHAGGSLLHGQSSVNNFSLGVEMERLPADDVADPWPDWQLAAASLWCAEKCLQYQIPLNRIVAHADVAIPAGRKIDPRNFPTFKFLIMVADDIKLLDVDV